MSLFFNLFASDRAQSRRDFASMKDLLKPYAKELYPIDVEDLENLSSNVGLDKKVRTSWTSFQLGGISTIFHEKVAVFSYRSIRRDKYSLTIRTNPYTYTYYITAKLTECFINDSPLAFIDPRHRILNRSGRQIIGRIDKSDVMHPELLIGEEEFGVFNRWPSAPKQHDRVFQFVRDMPEGIKELFAATTFYLMCANQWK